MIDFQRYALIAAIAALSFMLLTEWNQFRLEQQELATANIDRSALHDGSQSEAAVITESSDGELPVVAELQAPAQSIEEPAIDINSGTVRVLTDVLDVRINLDGGDITYVALPEHYASLDTPDEAFVLLEKSGIRQFTAQSGLIGPNGTDTAAGRPQFTVEQSDYELNEGEDSLVVSLYTQDEAGNRIAKQFHFHRGEYLIDLKYRVENSSQQAFKAALFTQLRRDNSPDPAADRSGGLGMAPFLGVAWKTPEDLYNKVKFGKMEEKPVDVSMSGGWIAMVQHYFVNAWIPDPEQQARFSTVVTKKGMNIARATGPLQSIAPGEVGEFRSQLYSGPKDQYRLEEISAGLDLTVDYSWLWWIAQPLFWLLTQFFSLTGNWGWSIILVTVLVKALFFKLNATAFRSMANMRRVQPKMLEIRERYGDDRQKQSQAMMELYKKEKVNPMGGCLPMLVQMPVFIALYWVLMESVELRHAPWILWINDLSAMDPYFILPLIMGASMFIQQRLNPPPPDPMQAKIMQWMPVVFTVFFLFFPAGLVLYWVVNNTLSIVQQWIITRNLEKAQPAKA